ncbi:MAG: nucleotide exchange factor GrpE [Vampirovibrionales bacterium]|nr:nucleotide exchange factor GrpE [Vampirovibrionales bacterium]
MTVNTSVTDPDKNIAESAAQVEESKKEQAQDMASPSSASSADCPQCQSLQEQLLRLRADFDNFRKRVESEKADLYKYGAERTIQGLLPVLDNLSRGAASLSETSDPKLLYQSFRMLHTQLMDSLSQQGLSQVKAVGEVFDPFYHEAVQRVHEQAPENQVVQEHQPGYTLHERVIRPAMVVVSAGPETPDSGENPFNG